jgi:thiamine kinase
MMSSIAAHQALERIPGWSSHNVCVLEMFGGSQTNESWLVERDQARYVLRIDTPLAATLGLDRQREMVIRDHVARAGLAPAVVFCDPGHGVMLSEYQRGRAWTKEDLHDEGNLELLASRLKRLYALPAVGTPLCLSAALLHYADRLGDASALTLAQEGVALVKKVSERVPVVCHNDLVAQNMVAGDRLWLIDWEYAGTGDALFDLAVVVEHHELPRSLWQPLVETCLGSVNRQIEEDLALYRAVYRRLVQLWRAVE